MGQTSKPVLNSLTGPLAVLTLVLLNPDMSFLCKQCRSEEAN